MSNTGAHDNHKLLSYHDNEPLQYDYYTINIIAHHYLRAEYPNHNQYHVCSYTQSRCYFEKGMHCNAIL